MTPTPEYLAWQESVPVSKEAVAGAMGRTLRQLECASLGRHSTRKGSISWGDLLAMIERRWRDDEPLPDACLSLLAWWGERPVDVVVEEATPMRNGVRALLDSAGRYHGLPEHSLSPDIFEYSPDIFEYPPR